MVKLTKLHVQQRTFCLCRCISGGKLMDLAVKRYRGQCGMAGVGRYDITA